MERPEVDDRGDVVTGRLQERGVVGFAVGPHDGAVGPFAVGGTGASHADVASGVAQRLNELVRERAAVRQHDNCSGCSGRAGRLAGRGRRGSGSYPVGCAEPLLGGESSGVTGAFVEDGETGLDPVALVLERIGRQRDAAAVLAVAEAGPVDVGTDAPHLPEHVEHKGLVVSGLVGVAQ